MQFKSSIPLALSIALLTPAVLGVDKTKNPQLVSQLKSAATQLDRLNLLPTNDDWIFDFTKEENWNVNAPGSVVNANAATFPAVIGNGMTMAVLNLGPCSMLPPHFHPRATNYVIAVKGTTRTYMITENGARTVETTLEPGKMTIFPQASIHTMQNIGCEDAQLISALNSEDQGTHNIVNGLFSLPDIFLDPATGYAGIDYNSTRNKEPPVGTGSIYGNKECLAKCGKNSTAQ